MLKSKTLHSFFILYLTMVLVACQGNKSEENLNGQQDSGNANFVIGNSSGVFVDTEMHKGISIPLAKVASFQTCLKSVTTRNEQKALTTGAFIVQVGDSSQTINVDSQGCLKWSERIQYNHLAKASLLTLERKIQGTGFFKGSQMVNFAINPWENQVFSLQTTKVDKLVPSSKTHNYLLGRGENHLDSYLFIEDLRVTIEQGNIDPKEGTTLNVDLRTQLKTPLYQSSGDLTYEPLAFGQFQSELFLIHQEPGTNKRRLLAKPAVGNTQLNGHLSIKSQFKMPVSCSFGPVYLGVRVKALNAPESLKPFEGAFILTECDSMKGNFFSRQKQQEENFSIEKFITDSSLPTVSETGMSPNDSEGYQRARIEIRKLNFNNLAFDDATSIERVRKFNIEACFQSAIDRRSISNQNITVKKVNGQTEVIRSSPAGCVTWDDSVAFHYLSKECWKSFSVSLSNTTLGINQSIPLLVNPWAANESFARDLRFIGGDQAKPSCVNENSQLVLLNWAYDKINFSYALDSLLNLRVKKRLAATFNIGLKRRSFTAPGGYWQDNMPIGYYLLKYAVVAHVEGKLDNLANKVYQAKEKIVFLQGNDTIAVPVEFETADIKAIGNTNLVFFELFPLDQKAAAGLYQTQDSLSSAQLNALIDTGAALDKITYAGPINLQINTASGRLTPLSFGVSYFDLAKNQLLKDQAEREQIAKNISGKNLFSSQNNFRQINMNDSTGLQNFVEELTTGATWLNNRDTQNDSTVLPAQIRKALVSGEIEKELQQRLCGYYFNVHFSQKAAGVPGNSNLKEGGISRGSYLYSCLNSFQQNKPFILSHSRVFLTNPKISSFVDGLTMDLNLGTNFQISRNYSYSRTKSFGWDIGGGLKLLDFGILSASTGAKYSISSSWATSEGDTTSSNFGSNIPVTFEQLRIGIQAESAEKCVLFGLNPDLYFGKRSWLDQTFKPEVPAEARLRLATHGLMFCDGAPVRKNFNVIENYYVLAQKTPYTQAIDPLTDATRPFYMNFRGETELLNVIGLMQSGLLRPDGTQINPKMLGLQESQAKAAFLRYTGSLPGQIVRPK